MLVKAARLGKVKPAQKLADKEHIRPFHARPLQWRAISDRGKRNGGPQVGEAAESCAQAQQSGLRLLLRRQMIELRSADGAQKHRVTFQAGLKRAFRQRRPVSADGGPADGLFLTDKFAVGKMAESAQDAHSFARDFRTNSVTGENCQLKTHGFRPVLSFLNNVSLRHGPWPAVAWIWEPARAGPGHRFSFCSLPAS